MTPAPVLDARAAAAIAAGMRAVALADGEASASELALVAAFEADLPPELDPTGVRFDDAARQSLLLESLFLVAWADGAVSEAERAVIVRIARGHRVTEQQITKAEAAARARLAADGHEGADVAEATAVGAELDADLP